MSKKLEDAKPGNLLVSVVRKVITEEQNDSSMEVETDNKKSFKDIVKADDDFASKVRSGKGIDKDKIHKGKGKEYSLKKETSQIKSKSKGNPKGNTKGKKGKSTQSNKTDGKGPKNVASPGKKKHRKKWYKRKKQRRQEWRQSKEGSEVTFSDVECLFVKLMKGTNEEDWNLLANFEHDHYTRIYDHKIRSVYNAESLCWTWRYIFTRNRKYILCSRFLACADRARKCLDELCWKIAWKHHFHEKESETLSVRVPYQCTTVFNQLPCPFLRSWLHRLKSVVFSVLHEERSRGKSSTAHCQHFSDDSLGFATHRDSGLCCLTTKNLDFAFIRHSETRDIAIYSLVPGSYEESHFLDLWFSGMMKANKVTAKGIGWLHGTRTKSAV